MNEIRSRPSSPATQIQEIQGKIWQHTEEIKRLVKLLMQVMMEAK